MKEKYLIIIDTSDYAGNFERELCAYVTGLIGESGVGEKQAIIFHKEVDVEIGDWFDLNVEFTSNYNPSSLSSTPGWFNDGFGKHYRNDDDPEIILNTYNNNGGTLTSADQITKYPSYQSIEIAFCKEPPYSIIELITERSKKFCLDEKVYKWCRPKEILDVRLVKRTTQDVEI